MEWIWKLAEGMENSNEKNGVCGVHTEKNQVILMGIILGYAV